MKNAFTVNYSNLCKDKSYLVVNDELVYFAGLSLSQVCAFQDQKNFLHAHKLIFPTFICGQYQSKLIYSV